MKVTFLPKTVLGRWSFWLIVAFALFFLIFQLLVASGQRGGETFSGNWLLIIPIFLAVICGISSLIVGLVSIIKDKERSILVFLSGLIGLFVLFFVIGELTVPH